jgi:hypothetical protein
MSASSNSNNNSDNNNSTNNNSSSTNNNNSDNNNSTEAYAIIQIDATGIKVIDAVPQEQPLNTGTPYELLTNNTPSIFAVKIVKKEKGLCNKRDQIKCIEYGDSVYEMDLSTSVTFDNSKLLSEDFLKGAGSEVDAKVVDGVKGKGAESEGADNGEGVGSNGDGVKGVDGVKGKGAESEGADNGEGVGSNGNGVKGVDGAKGEGAVTEVVDGVKVITSSDGTNDATSSGANAIVSGGSRKTLGPKSKKTKRNYYVYKR